MTENPYGTTTDYSNTTYQPDRSYSPPDGDGSDSPSAKDKASDAADAGKQAATDVAQSAADQAKDVAQETKKQARDLIGEARSQLNEQAGAQHKNLVTNLRALADELSSMAQGSENPGPATDLVSQAGDRAHGVADWLDQREPGDLLGEVRTFAQQRPGAFLLGALAVGVVAGRLTRGAVAAHGDDSSDAGSDVSATAETNSARHQAVDGVSGGTPGYRTESYPGTLPVADAPLGYDRGVAP